MLRSVNFSNSARTTRAPRARGAAARPGPCSNRARHLLKPLPLCSTGAAATQPRGGGRRAGGGKAAPRARAPCAGSAPQLTAAMAVGVGEREGKAGVRGGGRGVLAKGERRAPRAARMCEGGGAHASGAGLQHTTYTHRPPPLLQRCGGAGVRSAPLPLPARALLPAPRCTPPPGITPPALSRTGTRTGKQAGRRGHTLYTHRAGHGRIRMPTRRQLLLAGLTASERWEGGNVTSRRAANPLLHANQSHPVVASSNASASTGITSAGSSGVRMRSISSAVRTRSSAPPSSLAASWGRPCGAARHTAPSAPSRLGQGRGTSAQSRSPAATRAAIVQWY